MKCYFYCICAWKCRVLDESVILTQLYTHVLIEVSCALLQNSTEEKLGDIEGPRRTPCNKHAHLPNNCTALYVITHYFQDTHFVRVCAVEPSSGSAPDEKRDADDQDEGDGDEASDLLRRRDHGRHGRGCPLRGSQTEGQFELQVGKRTTTTDRQPASLLPRILLRVCPSTNGPHRSEALTEAGRRSEGRGERESYMADPDSGRRGSEWGKRARRPFAVRRAVCFTVISRVGAKPFPPAARV